MNLSCYIIDDESHAIDILRTYIKKTPGLDYMGESVNPLSALDEIIRTEPDLIFLDVDMPELNGLKLADLIGGQTNLVITTAYREYAVEAYQKNAIDYLLKPINYDRFLQCIQKARKVLPPNPVSSHSVQPYFFVKSGTKGKTVSIQPDEILYIAGSLNYVEIYFSNHKIMTYLTLKEILDKLPDYQFTRVHRSFIVNHRAINVIEPGQLRLKDATILPIGDTYRESFLQKIAQDLVTSKRDRSR